MSKHKRPWDLSTDDSGEPTCVRVLRALVETGSHFTDTMRFDKRWGRGVSLFMRVHVPEGSETHLRALLGPRCELREPPKVQL